MFRSRVQNAMTSDGRKICVKVPKHATMLLHDEIRAMQKSARGL